MQEGGLHAVEGAPESRIEREDHVVDRVVDERDFGPQRLCVVHQCRQGPEPLDDSCDHRLDTVTVGDVARDRSGLGTLLRKDRSCLRRARAVDVHGGDSRPGIGKRERDPATDATPSARDDRDSTVERSASPLGGLVDHEPQRVRPVEHAMGGVIERVPGPRFDPVEAIGERVEQRPGFEPCERRAGTDVRARTKRDVLAQRVALDVERARGLGRRCRPSWRSSG